MSVAEGIQNNRNSVQLVHGLFNDFSKYTEKVQAIKTSEVWRSIPAQLERERKKFKVYLLDTGLPGAMLKITSEKIEKPTAMFYEYNGVFVENFVASELRAHGYDELFYWTSKNEAEVDFILQNGNKLYPPEVKSGLSKIKKSLIN